MSVNEELVTRLSGRRLPSPSAETRLRVELHGMQATASKIRDAGGRFITIFLAGSPQPALVAAFALRGDLVTLVAPTGADTEVLYAALGPSWPAAAWAERELSERAAVRPLGLDAQDALTRPDPDHLERRVDGLDMFSLPFGPVRSGIFESIQFLIETGGENVPFIRTRPFFKHRGMEQQFEDQTPENGVLIAERVAGIASVAHACALAHAVETALGVEPPPRAAGWRLVHAELERIACHLDVIAKEAETTALTVGQARFQILKEQVMRIRSDLCGSRFGRGVVVPGGVRAEGLVATDAIRAFVSSLEKSFDRDRTLFLRTASMTDRLVGAGSLSRRLLEDYGAVGPLARGSGISVDARHERPYGAYRHVGVRVITATGNDAMARIHVRFGEIHESIRILRQALDRLDRLADDALHVALPDGGSGAGFGWTEAPQGELVTWAEVTAGRLSRVRIASPSMRNWALFDHAFPKDVLTDFAFIEHSFGLSVAGADR
jgi:formate hydrogenlyase subunit 5